MSIAGTWPGLVPVLAVIAALIMLVTDKYPPFRVDLGGREPEPADGD